ncbi:uncharacterized protein LOC141680994 [Apium graveolens]|uniref:uncharacterized protein LOC141680994 n=1 Tax=Apium graveolens TaxID=4045 RepID=UPI003D7B596E
MDQRDNKAASNKNKASVSENNEKYYTIDLKAMAASGVFTIHSHPQPQYTGPPVLNSAADPKNWDAFNNSLMDGLSEYVFNPSPPEHVPKNFSTTLTSEVMAAFGFSFNRMHPQPLYTGPPVLNSAADPKTGTNLINL